MTDDKEISPRLDEALRLLGDEYGPLGVALAAAHMTDQDALNAALNGKESENLWPTPAPDTYWNYRVVRTVEHGEDLWGIYEVHYTDGVPHSRTVDPVGFVSEEGVDSLANQLQMAMRATREPVLTDDDLGLNY